MSSKALFPVFYPLCVDVMNDDIVHIVGAGIGGLTLALGLLRAGRRVKVYEQAPQLGEIGAGLSISPNASKGLQYLDMLDFMEAFSNAPQENHVFHGQTNEALVEINRRTDQDRFGGIYYQIHRADFHSELVRRVQRLDPYCIELSCRLAAVKHSGEDCELWFSDGRSILAKIVIGADGIKSVTRDEVFRDCEPEFTGVMAWRGLVKASSVDPMFTEPVSRVWTGAGRTFVTYPIRQAEIVNVVAFGQAAGWAEEGWSVRAELEELKQAFVDWCEPVQALIKAVPKESLYRWGLFARRPLDSFIKGRVALIGDAAHPMLPWFGQGASSSIEDGVVMARCFEKAQDTAEAFALYNKARFERVTFLQAESNKGTERMQSADPYSLRDAPRRDEDALGIFKYDPSTVEL